MPKYVCRISHRRGEPLGLNTYPSATFLDLPLEIRDRIYQDVLISPNPILVWSGKHHESFKSENGREIMTETTTVEPVDPVLKQLTMGLLSCSSQTAVEAAATFYRCNTFKFAGDDIWQPLYGFLSLIGDRNTTYLRDLEVGMSRPVYLQTDRYGLRLWRQGRWRFGKVYPQCAYETGPVESILEQIVENRSPAIRYCFRALGKNGPVLKLRLILKETCFPVPDPYPGMFCTEESQYWDSGWEVPVLVERLRQKYTGDRVAVTWEGSCTELGFKTHVGDLEGLSWELVDAKDGEKARNEYMTANFPDLPPERVVFFKLRRK